MAEDVFGDKDLFSFHKKFSGPFAIDGSLFGKSSHEGLNATTRGNAGLSEAILNYGSHACDVCNIALVLGYKKCLGPSFPQSLSSPRGGCDVTGSWLSLKLKFLCLMLLLLLHNCPSQLLRAIMFMSG
ncbi:hypothetical protein PanWU01x14_280860 [Parasponia andersonii]|uniref:Uncharacterized protein n=1 Tax=Parasponia andersonii TaxID=3476 RepID=A0A2P5B1F7_PARAD|nr:hypothetical protein PanWU01x14_280860 [Parasponia andersonii]